MTSGKFSTCPIDSIIVNREKRQRRDLANIEELAQSIGRLGLIHPVVINRESILVAGERRLEACKLLGWTSIPFQYVDRLDPLVDAAIELEENIKRQDISWQDRTRAIVAYHKLRLTEPGWNHTRTAEALGIDRSRVKDYLDVAEPLEYSPLIKGATKFSTALGIVQRVNARKADAELASLYGPGIKSYDHTQPSIIHARFEDWLTTYDGPKFNFVHCDFPYGIGFDRMDTQAGVTNERYEDSFETYKHLIQTLFKALDSIITESCHLMFWFSMQSYQFTYEALSEGTGLNVDPYPIIWLKSDNIGILPDPSRGPRRIYETAFLCRRGDRKIVRAKSNAYAAPTTGLIHPHEKPEPMLRHFFEMFVDEQTVMLDPTCGSGGSLRAADSLRANLVVGVESNEEFARLANLELEKARRLRAIT